MCSMFVQMKGGRMYLSHLAWSGWGVPPPFATATRNTCPFLTLSDDTGRASLLFLA